MNLIQVLQRLPHLLHPCPSAIAVKVREYQLTVSLEVDTWKGNLDKFWQKECVTSIATYNLTWLNSINALTWPYTFIKLVILIWPRNKTYLKNGYLQHCTPVIIIMPQSAHIPSTFNMNLTKIVPISLYTLLPFLSMQTAPSQIL